MDVMALVEKATRGGDLVSVRLGFVLLGQLVLGIIRGRMGGGWSFGWGWGYRGIEVELTSLRSSRSFSSISATAQRRSSSSVCCARSSCLVSSSATCSWSSAECRVYISQMKALGKPARLFGS